MGQLANIAGLTALMMIQPIISIAEVTDPAAKAALACFDDKDWVCAFDGLADFLETSKRLETCASEPRGCGYEVATLYVAGIGAAEKVDPSERRAVAERALKLLGTVADGVMPKNGEILFSALRYDACAADGDEACKAESADMIRLAIKVGNRQVDFANAQLAAQGIHYPINLGNVIAEVSQTEKKL
ncbi:MAG: hypothetical protein ACK47Z_13130 [Paracoccaceae bacterium]